MKPMLFAPELILLLGSLLLFGQTLTANAKQSRATAITLSAAATILCLCSLHQSGSLFYKAYQVDLFSQLFKTIIALSMTLVLIFGGTLKDITPRMKPEYYLLLILSGLGLMMLVSSVELITLFVALELSSFSLYLLVPMRDDRHGVRVQMEAGIKYILFAVMATGVMLFGMSYLFGMTGSTYLSEIAPRLGTLIKEPAAVVGIAMILSGFLFKLAVFPFHFWVPDVYQGAANETSSFIAAVPKLAAVALLIRITRLAAPAASEIVSMLMICAVCSMFYGNFAALVQKDVKRLLGFSGIAHAGFVLLGILTFKPEGYATSIFYIIGYALMNMACFLVLCTVSKTGENVQIADLAGLYKRSPLLAFTLGIGMMALAGIPPFVGFTGEFMLMASALQAGHLTLVILAALNAAIAIYYYLSILKVTYCDAPEQNCATLELGLATKAVSLILIAAIITMGVNPSPILEIANRAVAAIL